MDVEVAHPALVGDVARRLEAAGVPSPRADARWLVAHVAAAPGDPAGAGRALLDRLVARRAAREPLQLVLGTAAFRTVELECRPGVFIPRPETEVVAGVAIDAARAAGPAPLVVDVCTGTGAIACAVLAEVPGVHVVASDRSPAAVALARHNLGRVAAGTAGTSPVPGARWSVVCAPLLDGVDSASMGHLDVLVANPPYLPDADATTWEPEVVDHDPRAALVGGVDGHELVDALLLAAPRWLRPGGMVVVEIDERRGADVLDVAQRGGLVAGRVVTDLTGADRAIVARRAG